mmetsp:Transcript_86624/g.224998  ORF Transcript_86624/g.224998 Transcript_86624/m.224998 type:complete len:119 (+) Transcript_86624:2-358(+)
MSTQEIQPQACANSMSDLLISQTDTDAGGAELLRMSSESFARKTLKKNIIFGLLFFTLFALTLGAFTWACRGGIALHRSSSTAPDEARELKLRSWLASGQEILHEDGPADFVTRGKHV